MHRPSTTAGLSALAIVTLLAGPDAAHSEDFFSQLFGGISQRSERPIIRLPFASELLQDDSSRRQSTEPSPRPGSGNQVYCVRTCDGRYFPLSAPGEQSKVTSCNNFCPSSETRVFYGSTIENASGDNGRRYTDLPNAFKYRTELVAGCTCNGKSTTGLAPVKIDDDPTLRRGDIVAGVNGLSVNQGSDHRGASLSFSPVSESIRARYDRKPVMAAE